MTGVSRVWQTSKRSLHTFRCALSSFNGALIPLTPASIRAHLASCGLTSASVCSDALQQDDALSGWFSVYETVLFAAEMKLPRSLSKEEKLQRVEEVGGSPVIVFELLRNVSFAASAAAAAACIASPDDGVGMALEE